MEIFNYPCQAPFLLNTIGLPYTGFGQNVFDFRPLSAFHLSFILSLVVICFICSEGVKLL